LDERSRRDVESVMRKDDQREGGEEEEERNGFHQSSRLRGNRENLEGIAGL